MTALAQGSAGVALVMCFALLRTGQVNTATILLGVQSISVAITAAVLHKPLIAMPPVILAAGFWLLRRQTPMFHSQTAPTGGAKLGICAGAVLAVLCQSQGDLAMPFAIVLLSIVLAATRVHPLMQVVALIAAQNGLALAGCLVAPPASLAAAVLLAIACCVLPLPLVVGLLVPAIASSPSRHASGPALELWRSWLSALWRRPRRFPGAAAWFGWVDLAIALAIFVATLIVPLDALASIFAPLLGIDGVLRSYVRRKRRAATTVRRASALLQSGCAVLAVCAPDLIVAWLGVLAAIAMALLPTMSRRWGSAVLALLGAGLGLFGVLLLPGPPSVLSYFSLLAGFVTIAAVVPDLAIVLAIVLLRLASQSPWPFEVAALGTGVAALALLCCSGLLTTPDRGRHRTTLLLLSQASIATLAICSGTDEGRFAAMILLILLVLSRAAARITVGPVAPLAMAGLGGIPPLGVFPGLVLVFLAMSAYSPWLLLPIGVALIPIVFAGVPGQRLPAAKAPPAGWPQRIPSVAWLPLLLALVTGYLAPDGFIQWCRIVTAGGI